MEPHIANQTPFVNKDFWSTVTAICLHIVPDCFLLQYQSLVGTVMMGTAWLAKLNIFIIRPFTESV
jgi:hypothetical protein